MTDEMRHPHSRLPVLVRTLTGRALHLGRHVRSESLHRNSLYIMAVTIVTSLLGFVYWLVAAHAYRTAQVGLAAALISAMTLVSMLCNLGINTALVQVLPQRRPGTEWSATLNAALLLGTVSSLVGGGIAVAALPLFSSDFVSLVDSPAFALAFVAGIVFTTATNLLDYACIAERAAGQTLARNFVFSAVKIPLLLWPLIAGLGTFGILLSWTASTGATVALMFLLLPRLGRQYEFSLRGVRSELSRLRSFLAGHHSMNIGSFAPWWMLPVLVTVQISPAATAYFYATWRVTGILSMVAPSFASSLAAEGAHDPANVYRKAVSSARATALLLAPACLVVILGGKWILGAFGSAYASHGLALLLLFVVAALPDAAMNLYVSILRVRGRLRFGGLLQLGTAAVALVAAWFLLPGLGIAGAGVAWLLSRVVGCVAIGLDPRRERELPDNRTPRDASAPSAPSAAPVA